MPSLSGGGRLGDVAPDVERAVGRAVDAHAEALEAGEQAVALLAEGRVDRVGLGDDVRVLEQRDRRALQRLRAAAVEERAGAGDRVDDLPRARRSRSRASPGSASSW